MEVASISQDEIYKEQGWHVAHSMVLVIKSTETRPIRSAVPVTHGMVTVSGPMLQNTKISITRYYIKEKAGDRGRKPTGLLNFNDCIDVETSRKFSILTCC